MALLVASTVLVLTLLALHRPVNSDANLKTAMKTIPKVARPRKDPVYGGDGPLLELWRAAR